MLLTPFPNAIGIDISDLSVKVVQLRNVSRRRSGPSYQLITARRTTLPHGLMTDGSLQEPEKIRTYIQQLLHKPSKHKKTVKSPWAVASIPDNHGFLKLIDVGSSIEELTEADILTLSKKHIPIDDDYYLDWEMIPDMQTEGKHTKVLIAAVPRHISDMYTYLLESVGLSVIALELKPLAVARAMITHGKVYEGEARAVLDVGATHSSVTIYDNGHIQFSHTLPFSGEQLTRDIAQKLHISHEEAEEKKKKYGLGFKNSAAWPIITKHTDAFVKDIEKTFKFYYSHFTNTNRVTHITMCGGASSMKRLDAVLTQKLGVPAEPGNVWKNLHTSKPVTIAQHNSLQFATAVGLALRAADNPYFTGDTI